MVQCEGPQLVLNLAVVVRLLLRHPAPVLAAPVLEDLVGAVVSAGLDSSLEEIVVESQAFQAYPACQALPYQVVPAHPGIVGIESLGSSAA